MSKIPSYTIFRLEQAIPTHCPACAKPFLSNALGDFEYDIRLHHPESAPDKFLAVFPAAGVADGLEVEPVWCNGCNNITLRTILAVRYVRTEAEAFDLLNRGFSNQRVITCHGNVPPFVDYTLTIVPDDNPAATHQTFIPLRDFRHPPRS